MGNFEINVDPPPPGGVVEIRGGGSWRGVVAIVVALVLVVVLFVALGRSRDKSAAEPPTTTVGLPTTTSVASTTRSEPTTTTAVPAVREYGPLLPEKTGIKLVLTQTDGHVVHVDLDSGTVTDLLPNGNLHSLYQMVALQNGVVVSGDTGPRLIADGEISGIGGSVDGVMGTSDGIHLIGLSYNDTGGRVVSLVPGGARDELIALPEQTDIVGLRPGTVLLQSRAGGVYEIDAATGVAAKVAEGSFLAAAGNRIASVTCDEALSCRIGIGPLGAPPDHQVDVVPGLEAGGFYYGGGPALSPTRDLVAYGTAFGGLPTVVVVLDLDAGATVLRRELFPGPVGPQFVWSPDGRWLFWVNNGHVNAWSPDRGGDPIDFATDQAGSAELIAVGF
ncbi:MAG: hypothetical protein ABJD24_12365 [Acidimicrobiales bacterium]